MYRLAIALCLVAGAASADMRSVEFDIQRLQAANAESKLRQLREQQDEMDRKLEQMRKDIEEAKTRGGR